MPEPFKTLFNPGLVQDMARHLSRAGAINAGAFLDAALPGLNDLEMMDRSRQISHALDHALPSDFDAALALLTGALHPRTDWSISDMARDDTGLASWAVAPMADWVARHGLHAPAPSLAALRQMTMRFSAEFAIRPFFRDHPDLTLRTVTRWLAHPNPHVRRLVSEGSRPRLPWGIRLHGFVQNPAPLIPLLTALRDDPSEYVRTSVANNLNDIAKDHPDLVARLAGDWMTGAETNRQRLIKRACRTLIKEGHPGAMAVFGVAAAELTAHRFSATPDTIHRGDTLTLTLDLTGGGADQRLIVDYIMLFRRANGQLSPKVFKWTQVDLRAKQTLSLKKTHVYRKVTTRRDYPGEQRVQVQVNGRVLDEVPFRLIVE